MDHKWRMWGLCAANSSISPHNSPMQAVVNCDSRCKYELLQLPPPASLHRKLTSFSTVISFGVSVWMQKPPQELRRLALMCALPCFFNIFWVLLCPTRKYKWTKASSILVLVQCFITFRTKKYYTGSTTKNTRSQKKNWLSWYAKTYSIRRTNLLRNISKNLVFH